MHRRFAFIATLILSIPVTGWAQDQLMRQFPKQALRGLMVFGEPPEILLNNTPSRLAPGARIRNENNMLVLSGTLTGTRITVHYTVDNGGQVKDVWLLSAGELANKPWPTSPLHTEAWSFDAGSQTWTKP